MQYFFAADRQNPHVADRYDPIEVNSLSMLKHVFRSCTRYQKPVTVCGELAGRPFEACILAALGYRNLSMGSGSIGPVKRALSQCHLGRVADKLETVFKQQKITKGQSLRSWLKTHAEDAGLPV